MMRSILQLLLIAMAVPAEGFRGSTNRKSEKVGGQQLGGDRASGSSSGSSSSSRLTGNRRILDDSETSSTTSSLHVSTTANGATPHSHQPHRSKHNNNKHNHSPNNKFKNFEEVLATYHSEPMMVMFTAVNCGPCKLMKHELNRVKGILGEEKFKLFAVDTEKFPHIGSRFDIHALPCLLLVQNGEPLLRIEGVLKAEKIMEQIQTTRLLQ